MPDQAARRATAIVASAESKARACDPRSTARLVAAGAVVAAAVLVLFVLYLNERAKTTDLADQLGSTSSRLDTVQVAQNQAATSAQALASQVKSLGHTPVVYPPSPIIGATGSTGARGEVGAPGAVGSAGPVGPTGVPGVAGKDGAGGAPGAVGAQGPVGPAGPTGATGATGPAGPPGANGANGANGSPPVGWTYTDTLGIQHTCTRDAASPATAPTYSCT